MMAAACNKVELNPAEGVEESTPAANMIVETISATTEMSTKATIANSDGAFAWTAGEHIAVHVSNGGTHKYVLTSDTGGSGASDAAGTASFTIAYESGFSRDAFAVYPSTIVDGGADNYGVGGPLKVTLPSSYTLAQVSGETTPCPMIADNTGSGWTFSQLCGLLRLTVKSIPADATGLAIQFPGRKVNGSFSIASPVPGSSTITTDAPGSGEDCITVTFAAGTGTEMTLNIPLPTGVYEYVYITPLGSSTKVAAIRHIKAASYVASRAQGKKLTATLVSFSVSASKKVIFAPGNLQATYDVTGQSWSWHFAANQYERIGNGSGNKLITTSTKETTEPYAKLSAGGTVDMFGRSTDKTYYGIAISTNASDYSGAFIDWGGLDIRKNATPPYAYYTKNYWQTLSETEWQYLIGEGTYRTTGGTIQWTEGSTTHVILNALCTKATVNGIYGFIIFPDHYSGNMPLGVAWDENSISSGNMAHSGTTGWKSTATSNGWEALEAEGCVFLPVEGLRLGYYEGYGNNVIANGSDGYYMSSNSASVVLRFSDAGFDPNQGLGGLSYAGRSVRLAHEIE